MKRIVFLLLVPVMLSLVGCGNTSVRQDADWESRRPEIKTVAVAVNKISVTEVNMTADGGHVKEQENAIARYTETGLIGSLAQHGFSGKAISSAELSANPDLAFSLKELGQTYEAVAKDAYKQPQMDKEKAFRMNTSVGAVAAPVAAATGSDAILLVDYDGYTFSAGKIVANAVISALLGSNTMPQPQVTTRFVLIDGHNGDVLCSNLVSMPGDPASVASAQSANILREMLTLPAKK